MSWLGVAIGLGIAVVFLSLVFLILWLFPGDHTKPVPVKHEKSEKFLLSYKVSRMEEIQGEIDPFNDERFAEAIFKPKRSKCKQGLRLGLCPKFKQKDESRRTTVPGMEPSSNWNGNINDIGKAGSLHEFLVSLHKEFGPIASFWWGTQHTVSISSPELFKQQQDLFDKPADLFRVFEPILTPYSLQYTNGADGKARRIAFDKVFEFDSLGIYYDKLQKIADEVVHKWERAEADDHFPLRDNMFLYAAKAVLVCLLGDNFNEDKKAFKFKHNYDVVIEEMEQRLSNPILPKENSARIQQFRKANLKLRQMILHALEDRVTEGKAETDTLLIDAIIAHHSDDERRLADALTYAFQGFHTTACLLTWSVYYLCRHEDVQEKLYEEISTILGIKHNLTHQNINKLRYLRQVIEETLRCAMVTPWAARCSEQDAELAGHRIPAETPVIHALGVSLMDEKIWTAPTVFDPDRFSDTRSKGRPSIAFSPFGFAGRRQCPGYRFAYVEASVLLVTALQKVKFLLVPGQEVKVTYSVFSRPKDEIWLKVVKRE